MQCDLVSGFVRFQWQLAIAAPTRMRTSKTDNYLTSQCSVAEARQHSQGQGLLEITAEGRVGSLGGMLQGQTRAPKGIVEIDKTRTNLPALVTGLFQSFGGLYFPQDHSQRRTETFSIALVIKIVTASRTRWCCAGIVDVRSSACTEYFERTLRRCARCCKNSATRAQLGPPNWILA